MRTDDRRRAVARCAEVAGWGSQDIPSGSYPGTPRSPVRHPEIDGSKGPDGRTSGPGHPSPAIEHRTARRSFRDGSTVSDVAVRELLTLNKVDFATLAFRGPFRLILTSERLS